MMRKSLIGTAMGCGALMLAAGFACVGQVPGADASSQDVQIQDVKAQNDADQAKLDKQLADLEAQRAKIDAQIRELHRKMGRDRSNGARAYVFRDENGNQRVLRPSGPDNLFDNGSNQRLAPDQQAEVRRALEEARRAVQQAQRDVPKGLALPNLPDFSRIPLASPNGGQGWSSQDRARFEEQMKQFGDEMRKYGEQWRTTTPRIYSVTPDVKMVTPQVLGGGTGMSPEVRRELQQLRDEIRALRDEMRRERGRTGQSRSNGRDDADVPAQRSQDRQPDTDRFDNI